MVQAERLSSYLHSLIADEPEAIDRIEKQALQDRVPIIKKETKELLKVLVRMHDPKRILEIGTAVGYSALIMLNCMTPEGSITTIENYPPRIAEAKRNFAELKVESRIRLYEGGAMQILPTLSESYDMVFLDAAKGQYLNYLPEILRLLQNGGILITDNVLQDGDVLESKYAIEKRNRTIHDRMRDYLYEITHREGLCTSVIPIGDGVSITIKGE